MGTIRATRVFFTAAISLVVASCGKVPENKIPGLWTNPDGSQIVLNSDKTCSIRSLPVAVFLGSPNGGTITGAGRWTFESHNSLWNGDSGIIALSLDDVPGYPPRLGIELILSGDKTLYQWKGEEGGARYQFTKDSQLWQ
jgi:hypothetical protein